LEDIQVAPATGHLSVEPNPPPEGVTPKPGGRVSVSVCPTRRVVLPVWPVPVLPPSCQQGPATKSGSFPHGRPPSVQAVKSRPRPATPSVAERCCLGLI
jgi:hypothetical protein